MFGKSHKSHSHDFFITLDIGSSRVVGALVKKKIGVKPEILFVSYQEMPFQEVFDVKRFSQTVVGAIDACLKELGRKFSSPVPTRVLCTLSAIMYEASLHVQHKPLSAETKITSEILRPLDLDAAPSLPEGRSPLEHATIQIKLNGYPVARPVGQSAHQIETVTYMSNVGSELLKSIREIVLRHFHGVTVGMHSFSFIAFTVLREIIHEENFVFLDFGGEITDIIIVRRGVLDKTISIPFGKNIILREIMSTLRVSCEIAQSSLNLYHEGKLSSGAIEGTQKALDACRQRWDTLFLGTLEHVTLDSLLPQDVYVLAHASMMPITTLYLEAERYNRYVFVGQPFRVHEINDKTLHTFCTAPDQSTFPDPFVVISSLFSDTL